MGLEFSAMTHRLRQDKWPWHREYNESKNKQTPKYIFVVFYHHQPLKPFFIWQLFVDNKSTLKIVESPDPF